MIWQRCLGCSYLFPVLIYKQELFKKILGPYSLNSSYFVQHLLFLLEYASWSDWEEGSSLFALHCNTLLGSSNSQKLCLFLDHGDWTWSISPTQVSLNHYITKSPRLGSNLWFSYSNLPELWACRHTPPNPCALKF